MSWSLKLPLRMTLPRLSTLMAWSVLSMVGACSDVKFSQKPAETCIDYTNSYGPNACVVNPRGEYEFKYNIVTGAVDIVVVDDNSGSMYPEQVEMANRFPGFLDSLFRLDYRLAIITTDVTTNGGGFLSFPNGQKYIWNNSRSLDARHNDNIRWFQDTIKRPETLACDASGYQNCPSGDERGIFALNLAMERSDQRGYFRPGGHLAVVILSDEDERSNGGQISGYPLEAKDLPSSFAAATKSLLTAGKTVSVHSIIIDPGSPAQGIPADVGCFNVQNSQPGVRGYYGTQYAALSRPSADLLALGNLVPGTVGSICSVNYTNELGRVSDHIRQTTESIQLPCRPINDQVSLSFSPAPTGAVTYTIDSANRLLLNPSAPPGVTVSLAFKCRKL